MMLNIFIISFFLLCILLVVVSSQIISKIIWIAAIDIIISAIMYYFAMPIASFVFLISSLMMSFFIFTASNKIINCSHWFVAFFDYYKLIIAILIGAVIAFVYFVFVNDLMENLSIDKKMLIRAENFDIEIYIYCLVAILASVIVLIGSELIRARRVKEC